MNDTPAGKVFEVGELVYVSGDPHSPYLPVRQGGYARVKGSYLDSDTRKLVYRTTIGDYYAERVSKA